MERTAVYVTEKKEKIERIKKKYNNMSLSDNQAEKINKLEVTNNVLKGATAIIGIATVINWLVPDAIPFIDEAILTGITTLLGSASTIVQNNIDSIALTGTADVKIEEIQKLTNQAGQIASNIKNKRTK